MIDEIDQRAAKWSTRLTVTHKLNRFTETCSLGLQRTSPLTSIKCPFRDLKYRADGDHMFLKVDCCPGTGFRLDRSLNPGYLIVIDQGSAFRFGYIYI